ncbi:MAG TPA: SIMPL domain-containing protein [Methylibium sp.]|uniref:SIMPL domain-containing protein n=1 Tax=Methylibium sp. TaxID=2067992 RepID=UPI002DBD806C|nr:SIMPL domain-containing protein [Methylibium sp.]HEU4457808.1 SIMPL domain-containing protein [Methylibium sp.]
MHRSLRHRTITLLFGTLASALPAAHAADAAPRESLVSFSTTAQVEVTMDQLAISLQAVKEGQDAATVQAQLKQALDAALAEAKKTAAPGAMEVRSGSFSLHPRYAKEGRIGGWQGQAELVLEGKDMQRVAAAAGRLGAAPVGMAVTSVAYAISRELAEKHEAEVSAQAIQKYRAKAEAHARQFGFASWQLREVSVQAAEQGGRPRVPMPYAKSAIAMSSDAPVPVEAGKGVIAATVSGSVALTK